MTTTKLKGLEAMAVRITNAQINFVEVIMAKGFTREDAQKAMHTLLKLKLAKLDSVGGVIRVKHGVYLEEDVLRNAVNF